LIARRELSLRTLYAANDRAEDSVRPALSGTIASLTTVGAVFGGVGVAVFALADGPAVLSLQPSAHPSPSANEEIRNPRRMAFRLVADR
jgi:hypothetical protein